MAAGVRWALVRRDRASGRQNSLISAGEADAADQALLLVAFCTATGLSADSKSQRLAADSTTQLIST